MFAVWELGGPWWMWAGAASSIASRQTLSSPGTNTNSHPIYPQQNLNSNLSQPLAFGWICVLCIHSIKTKIHPKSFLTRAFTAKVTTMDSGQIVALRQFISKQNCSCDLLLKIAPIICLFDPCWHDLNFQWIHICISCWSNDTPAMPCQEKGATDQRGGVSNSIIAGQHFV